MVLQRMDTHDAYKNRKWKSKEKNKKECCRIEVLKKFGVPTDPWMWIMEWFKSTEIKIDKRRRRKVSVVSNTIPEDL